MQKKLELPYLPELAVLPLEETGKCLRIRGKKAAVNCANWEAFPERPEVVFSAAHTGKTLVLAFSVREDFLLARFESDQSPVYQDSCVEFFCRKKDSPVYMNLEFNCIGTCLGARQSARDTDRVALTPEELHHIERFASLGRKALGEKRGEHVWELVLRIPFSLLDLKEGDFSPGLKGNFYKCCDGTPVRHYLSWNPVQTTSPDFHQPDFFGDLVFLP